MKAASLVLFALFVAACGSFGGSSPDVDAGAPEKDAGPELEAGETDSGSDANVTKSIEGVADAMESPYGFVIDGEKIYVAARNDKLTSVYVVPANGGQAKPFAAGKSFCSQVAVDADTVYFSCRDGLFSVKKDASAGGPISTNKSDAVAVTDASVFTCQYDGEMGRDVTKIDKDGTDPVAVASNIVQCESFARRGTDIFFGGYFIGKIGSVDHVDNVYARRIAADATFIFSLPYSSGVVRRSPIAGGGGIEFALTPDGLHVEAGDIAVDDTHVYWSVAVEGQAAGRLYRADKQTRTPELIADKLKSPNGIAVSGDYIYWTEREAGTLKRRRK